MPESRGRVREGGGGGSARSAASSFASSHCGPTMMAAVVKSLSPEERSVAVPSLRFEARRSASCSSRRVSRADRAPPGRPSASATSCVTTRRLPVRFRLDVRSASAARRTPLDSCANMCSSRAVLFCARPSPLSDDFCSSKSASVSRPSLATSSSKSNARVPVFREPRRPLDPSEPMLGRIFPGRGSAPDPSVLSLTDRDSLPLNMPENMRRRETSGEARAHGLGGGLRFGGPARQLRRRRGSARRPGGATARTRDRRGRRCLDPSKAE